MTRDMSEREFKAAAHRNQFSLGPLGLIDRTAEHGKSYGTSYGYVFRQSPFRLLRRASLARAIRHRERDQSREET